VGQRLAKESPRQNVPYQFHVVDMAEPNAFALRRLCVPTRGLLALSNSEDELTTMTKGLPSKTSALTPGRRRLYN
jgi:predicted Zn-dependent protease